MALTDDGTSLVDPAARWIGLADWRADALIHHEHPYLFSRQLPVPDGCRAVQLSIACNLRYAVYVDGMLVHEGPARALAGEAFVDQVDVPCPSAGSALMSILVMPMSCVSSAAIHDRIGVIATVRANDRLLAVTDASWGVRRFDEVKFHGRLCSLGVAQQEHWSAGLTSLRSDSGENALQPARVLGSVGTPPWRSLLVRDCDILRRRIFETPAVFFGSDDAAQSPADADLARAFNDRPVQKVSPRDAAGEFSLDASCNVVTFDAGRTRMLRPLINVVAADAGARLEIFYDIALAERPRASLGSDAPLEGFVDSVTCATAPLSWQPIVPRGARFVTIRLAGPGRCGLRVKIEASDYPYGPSVAPRLPRPVLNEIWDRSVATLRSSTTDTIVDTVWRENMLWTFDAAVTGQAHFHAFADRTQWRRALALIARWAEQNSPWPTSALPSGASGVILPDQLLQAIIALADYARLTGERQFALEALGCFNGFIDACLGSMTADGLFIPPDWCWHWIDWAPVDRRPYSLPINLLLMLACETMLNLGDPAAVNRARLTDAARTLREKVAAFWDERRGCYRDRIEPPTPQPAPNQVIVMPPADYSAHSNALALRAGLGSPAQQSRVAQYLVDHLPELPFGPGWTDLILSPLLAYGHVEKVIDHLERLYRPWIESDQPTWSEGFEHRLINTAHGWGATAISVLTNIAAMKQPHPTWAASAEPAYL